MIMIPLSVHVSFFFFPQQHKVCDKVSTCASGRIETASKHIQRQESDNNIRSWGQQRFWLGKEPGRIFISYALEIAFHAKGLFLMSTLFVWPRIFHMNFRHTNNKKLETEPLMEKMDMCPAYQHLRRQPGDWNDSFYMAWSEGKTGFPFVDACMRCLLKHGWMNFRMRAMLVSFATWSFLILLT
jgi:hypothetical protein